MQEVVLMSSKAREADIFAQILHRELPEQRAQGNMQSFAGGARAVEKGEERRGWM